MLAWLLDPGETHGVGRAFLNWFLGGVNESIRDRVAQRAETGSWGDRFFDASPKSRCLWSGLRMASIRC